jgi:hypothetical protein
VFHVPAGRFMAVGRNVTTGSLRCRSSVLRALDGTARLLHGRIGRIDVVYVAHLSSLDMLSHGAIAEMDKNFDEIEQEHRTQAAGHLRASGAVHRCDAETLEGRVVLFAGPGASCRHRGRARLDQRLGRPRPEFQPLEALGEGVRGDPGDLAGRVIEPLRPAGQRPGHSSVHRSPTLASARQAGGEPFSRSAMSGS